jgi:hypothetical protein
MLELVGCLKKRKKKQTLKIIEASITKLKKKKSALEF